MKLNIFSKFNRKSDQKVKACPFVPTNDDTVITNFTESYLEAYFDGELELSEERQLEGVLGHRYIQDEMLKRGELRSIINRQSVLSIPSAHDLKQEKKRVWNELEHELKLHLKSQAQPLPQVSAYRINYGSAILKSLSAGVACLVIGFIYSSSQPTYKAVNNGHDIPSEYVLNNPQVFREMVSMGSQGGSYKVKERESISSRELKLVNQEELSNLGAFIVKNEEAIQDPSMLTFVSNQGRYE